MNPRIIHVLFFSLLTLQVSQAQVLVETESFENKGGWLPDHQAFEKIGSAYLNAHGLGKPVRDASTTVHFNEPGNYHVYVLTYNWTSPWYKGKGPGVFNLVIDGKTLPNELGNYGNSWEWQLAGKVKVGETATVVLHDLTGFNGRADAICFSKDQVDLPTSFEELIAFRNVAQGQEEPVIAPKADLVVVGAGVAGIATALTAARYGVNVILVDNLPELGGNNYLGVGLSGAMHKNLYPRIGDIVRELTGIPYYEDSREQPHLQRPGGTGYPLERKTGQEMADFREQVLKDAGVLIYHNTHVYFAESRSGKIVSVTGRNLKTGEETIFTGRLFADCTGDGTVGYLAGADFHIGRESRDFANESLAPETTDQKKMGMTLKWGSRDTGKPNSFPMFETIPWAMECTEEYHLDVYGNKWWWETGLEIDNAKEAELVRDNMLRAIFGNWSYLKNNLEKFRTRELSHIGHIGMKRESRRLLGDIILNENDFRDQVEYPDASFTATWPFDLHYATPENSKYYPGWEWQTFCLNEDSISWIEPYSVPYRTLYSRNINNLFMAGRCISVTHVALGPTRVQCTTGMMGEVVGMAAKICAEHQVFPRAVYENYLEELKKLMIKGPPLTQY